MSPHTLPRLQWMQPFACQMCLDRHRSVSQTSAAALETLPVREALDSINGTFDLDLLKEWDRAENRVRIKNAIAKRIKAVTEGEG